MQIHEWGTIPFSKRNLCNYFSFFFWLSVFTYQDYCLWITLEILILIVLCESGKCWFWCFSVFLILNRKCYWTLSYLVLLNHCWKWLKLCWCLRRHRLTNRPIPFSSVLWCFIVYIRHWCFFIIIAERIDKDSGPWSFQAHSRWWSWA